MAISFVGSTSGLVAATTSTVTFNTALKDTSNATGVNPVQNDLVVICQSRRSAGAAAITAPTGYSTLSLSGAVTNLFVDNTDDTNVSIFYKFMGATPDTSVTLNGPGATQVSSYTIHVLRGVDTTTPFDGVTPPTVSDIATGAPDPAAVTPATTGAWVMVWAACASANSAGSNVIFTAPSNIDTTTNFFQAVTGTRTGTAGGIFSSWTSGAFDPNAFGGGIVTSGGSSGAITAALRPAATGGRTGTLSATESGADAFAASAQVKVSTSLVATESGSDAFAGSAAVKVTGSLSGVETGSDALTAAAQVKVAGLLVAIEIGADTFAGLGIPATFPPVTPIGWMQKLKSGSWAAAAYISGSVWTQKQQGKPTW